MPVTPNAIVTPQAVKTSTGVAVTANTTLSDTPTNTVVCFTAGANGARVTRISAMPRATVTATEMQLYRDGDGTGTVRRLFQSELMTAHTVAATTKIIKIDFGYTDANPLILGAGEKIYCAIAVSLAGGIVFTVEGADY